MTIKPICYLTGTDGNIFSLVSVAALALKKAQQRATADEMKARVLKCQSYAEALAIISEYCEVK